MLLKGGEGCSRLSTATATAVPYESMQQASDKLGTLPCACFVQDHPRSQTSNVSDDRMING